MPNNHLQIDIETGGTGFHAWILTIGFLKFDPLGDGSEDVGFHFTIPPEFNKGRVITFDTIKWWMQQSQEAIANSWLRPKSYREDANGRFEIPHGNVFGELETAFQSCDHIWANDPTFDLMIVKDWLDENNRGIRYPFPKERSQRTIKALYNIPKIDNALAHDALADCRYQAAQVRAVFQGNAPWRG